MMGLNDYQYHLEVHLGVYDTIALLDSLGPCAKRLVDWCAFAAGPKSSWHLSLGSCARSYILKDCPDHKIPGPGTKCYLTIAFPIMQLHGL